MFRVALIAHQSLTCMYLNCMLPNAFKTFLILSSDPTMPAPRVFGSNTDISQECVITLCLPKVFFSSVKRVI